MRIDSPFAISVDSVLPFRIAVSGQTTDVSCRVAVCRPSAGCSGRYGVGLEFLDLDAAFREHLATALQRYAAEQQPD